MFKNTSNIILRGHSPQDCADVPLCECEKGIGEEKQGIKLLKEAGFESDIIAYTSYLKAQAHLIDCKYNLHVIITNRQVKRAINTFSLCLTELDQMNLSITISWEHLSSTDSIIIISIHDLICCNVIPYTTAHCRA